MQSGRLYLLGSKRGVGLLPRLLDVRGTSLRPMKKSEMNAGSVYPETFQEIRGTSRCMMSAAPKRKSISDCRRKKLPIFKYVNV
jgi:hypothetical protein